MEYTAGATILNVDDNEIGRYSVTRTLKQAGFEVMEAATGEEALKLALKFPDLILLDVNLPDISGFEVCRRLKSDPVTSTIPILHLSATHLDTGATVTGLEGGADGYLTQPVESTLLLAHVKALIRASKMETRLARMNRSLKAMSYCSQALVRAESELELVQEVCRILVEIAGHRFVWVGSRELDRDRTIRPIATCGDDGGLLGIGKASWAESAAGCCPMGEAIRTGKPFLLQDIRTDSQCEPWRTEAINRGFATAFALPLIIGDHVWGGISICGDMTATFDRDERDLLWELAQDLAYGIDSLRTREEARRGHEALRESERKYRELVQNANSVIIRWKRDGSLTFFNEYAEGFFGYSADEVLGQNAGILVPATESTGRDLTGLVDDIVNSPERYVNNINENVCKDGRRVWMAWTNKPILDDAGQVVEILGIASDISDQKEAETALRVSDERYQRLFAHAPLMYVLTRNEQGVPFISECNELFLSTVGHPREDVVGQPLARFYSPKSRDALLKGGGYTRALAGEYFMGERELLTREGKLVPTLLYTEKELDGSGNVTGTRAMFVDITDLKTAEANLRLKNSAIESSISGISIADLNGNLTYVNPAALRLWGYDREEEVLGKRALGFWITEMEAREALQSEAQTGSWIGELIAKRKDGSPLDIQVAITLVREPNGAPVALMGSFLDISERKRAVAALEEREQKLKSIFRASPVGIGVVVDRVIREANETLCEMVGYSREELLDQNSRLVYASDEDFEFVGSEKYRQISENGTGTVETRWRRKDGEVIDVLLSSSPIDPADMSLGVTFTALDITERKKAEKSVFESHQLLNSVMDAVPDLLIVIDKSYRIQYTNFKGHDLIVQSDLEKKKTCYGRFKLLDAPCEDCNARRVFESRSPAESEMMNPADGRLSEVRAFPILDEFGEVHAVVEHVRDITERKKAEDELRKSEERFRDTFEQAAVGIAHVASDGSWLLVNQKLCDIVGYSREELLTKTFQDITYPADLEIDLAYVRQVLADKIKTYSMEKRYIRKDGSLVWINLTVSLVRNTAGATDYFISVIEDITSRKQMEVSLKESEERYRYLVENIDELICTHDLQGNLLFVSSGPAHLLGSAPGDMVGKNLRSYLAPEVRDQFDEYLATIQRDGRASGLMLVQSSSGEKRLWEYRNKLHGATGSEPLVLGVARDVTERRQAEEALRESRERYQKLFNESKDGVYITGLDGQLLDANEAFYETFGYARDEILGQDIRFTYANPSDRDRFVQAIEEQGFLKDFPLVLKRSDGSQMECLLTSSVRRAGDGTAIGYQGILRDTTEQRNLQKQLLQAQKMEAIGTLAGGVAHDFNNVLQVALGYSDLILSDEKFPTSYRADLHKIHESARRGADLVQRLLTFSRKVEIKPSPINLNYRITELRKMVERTIPKMIDVQLILSESLASINADPTQIDQVLMNLAVNARDAMPEGGKLIFETANIMLDEEYAKTHLEAKLGPHVLLMVTDTGSGMDQETLEHIFEPFYTTKAVGEGTGLGLAMVHGIVKNHGGHITCYSEPGQGTTFKIYIPALIADEVQEEKDARPMPRGGSETILLVDDEEIIRDLGSRILSKGGYKVVLASNGKDALKLYQQRRDEISLVILDLIMPEMGGKQCLEALASLDPSVKVVIASGYSPNGPTKKALAAGAKGFVNKPYDIRQVLEVVREVLDKE